MWSWCRSNRHFEAMVFVILAFQCARASESIDTAVDLKIRTGDEKCIRWQLTSVVSLFWDCYSY